MKPMHGEFKRVSGKGGCPCCKRYTKHSKHNSGDKNNGKSSARNKMKNDIKEQIEKEID